MTYQYFKRRDIKPIRAIQWFKNGDHPEDGSTPIANKQLSEGKVVTYYNNPILNKADKCDTCGKLLNKHGFIKNHMLLVPANKYRSSKDAGVIVCPGSWVMNEVKNKYTVLTNNVFKVLYETAPLSQPEINLLTRIINSTIL